MAVRFQGGQARNIRPVLKKQTYAPESFYGPDGRHFSLEMVTPEDKAQARQLRNKARQLFDQLLSTLEAIPRTDQFEEIPDLIRKLRNSKGLI